MPRQYVFTAPRKVKELIQLRSDGYSVRELMTHFEVSESTIRKLIAKHCK